MAKITVAGNAIVITSAYELEEIKFVEKYKPDALKFYEENKKGELIEVFRVGTTKTCGGVTQYGILFDSESRDGKALASLTCILPDDIKAEDTKAYVVDEFGGALMKLNKIEEHLKESIEDITKQRAEVEESIETI